MAADPLSDVLALSKPRTVVVGGLDLGGEWCIAFEPHAGIKCYAVTAGVAWFSVEGEDSPLLLEAGDCLLLPKGKRFLVASELSLTPVPFASLPRDWEGGITTVDGGGTVLLAGHFDYAGAHAELLLGAMPVVRLREPRDRAGLRWILEQTHAELSAPRPGSVIVMQHLAQVLLAQALRLYLATPDGPPVGWLAALRHPKITRALSAMHAAPAARWTVRLLALEAGMSRSDFAQQFRALVGESPIGYLTRWRMCLAGDRLLHGRESVSTVGLAVGYESESAFSAAFRRVMGCPPRAFAGAPGHGA